MRGSSSCRIYKPRRARESPLFRLVEQHLGELLRGWPARFVRQRGPLRPVVERVLREFLKCGLECGCSASACSTSGRSPRSWSEKLLSWETPRLLRPRG